MTKPMEVQGSFGISKSFSKLGYKEMKNIISLILLMGSLVALTACGGGGGKNNPTTDDSASGSTLSVFTISGRTIEVNTTNLPTISTACYTNNSNGVIETMSIVNTAWTNITKTYNSDTTCSGTPTSTTTVTATLAVDQDIAITGWIDDQQQTATAPGRAGNVSNPLVSDQKYTRMSLTVTASDDSNISVGFQTQYGYIIDDSHDSGVVLYRVDGTNKALIVEAYSNIVTNGYLTDSYFGQTYVDNTEGVSVDTFYDTTTTKLAIKVRHTIYSTIGSTFELNLPFDFATGTFNDGNGLTLSANLNGMTYVKFSDAGNFITFDNSGNVGESVKGSYQVKICESSCANGNEVTVSGTFDLIRGANNI